MENPMTHSVENDRPVRNIHYEGRNLRERLTNLVESWQSTGPKQQSTRDLLTDIIGVLGEYDPIPRDQEEPDLLS